MRFCADLHDCTSDAPVADTIKGQGMFRGHSLRDQGPIHAQVSHMGHARNYLTSDVIRRVLEDYFGYSVYFVMNVTDVDDKIILKARRAHHLQRFRDSRPPPDQVS